MGNNEWRIEILKAADRGEQIQQRDRRFPEAEWEDTDCPDWNFSIYDYRVRPTLMTYRQLSEWMAKGFGEVRMANGHGYSRVIYLDYWEEKEKDVVSTSYEIRYWQTEEWLKPSVEIYKKDCLKNGGIENT